MVECVIPEARALYLTAQERTIHDEAATYAERYRKQAEQLNEREAASRWQGAALSDNEVRRISSFLKSYNVMRKGEEFVQREVRGRARMRNRWLLGLGLVLGGGADLAFEVVATSCAEERDWVSCTASLHGVIVSARVSVVASDRRTFTKLLAPYRSSRAWTL